MIVKLNRFWYSLLLVAVGAGGALAMPPYGQWWVLAPVFSIFVFSEGQRNSRRSLSRFFSGWLFGLGYFLAVLQWISNAFFVDAQNDLWMMPIAVGGLAALLAAFWGVANLVSFQLQRFGISTLWSLPLCLGIAEFVRGQVLSGFPWAVPGLAVDGMGGVAQAASVIGMNGLTFLVLAWAVAPLVFVLRQRSAYVEAAVVLLLLPVLWIWGDWRISNNPTGFVSGVTLRLVQPNVPQNEKWRKGNAPKIWNTLLEMTKEAPTGGAVPTHVIWPESSVPFLLDESSEAKDELLGALGGSKVLITGAVRRQRDSTSGRVDYFTSVEIFDSGVNLVGKYDKWHLVPGGEFLPMAWLLEPLGLRRLVSLPESFTAGSGPQSLVVPGAGVVAPSICYEAIFPEAFSGFSSRPDWFVNVTNDGWFGDSAGPHQHLAQLRLRAIEQGIPIARSANTGISAVIDPVGRYVVQTPIKVKGVYDVALPKAISATVFSQWGFVLQFALPLLMIFIGVVKKRPKNSIHIAL